MTSPDQRGPSTPLHEDAHDRPAGPQTLVFGIIGGIASGKSTVSEAIAGAEGLVLSADLAAHEALDQPEIQAKIRERFGAEAIGDDGRTIRPVLAKVIFDDPAARKAVESWIHPAVRAKLRGGLEDARERGIPRVVLDVPLLLEHAEQHGLVDLCDYLVFVDVPLDVRDRRAAQTRGWEPGEVARREEAQLPIEDKRRRADILIRNDGDRDSLIEAVELALARL